MVKYDPIHQWALDIVIEHGATDCDGSLFADAPYCNTLKDPVLCPACRALANAIESTLRNADKLAREDERQDVARMFDVFEKARARYKAVRAAKLNAQRGRQ